MRPEGVRERLGAVRRRIALAAERVGREPGAVRIVVACKTFGVDTVEAVLDAGATDLGENYVQEAMDKQARVGSRAEWHLIGALQRNKARLAAEHFAWVQSLDRLRLAKALDRAGRSFGIGVRCLVQVNLAGERTKAGLAPEDVRPFLERMGAFEGLRIQGLMTIPPPVDDPEESRPFFERLRLLRDGLEDLRRPNVHLKELSMGMSSDFEIAVEEGATMVRIGTAILGPRPGRR